MPFIQGGVIPALLTPFTKGGKEVDFERAAGLAEFLADKGVNGLFVAGTTGEGMLMSLDERKQLLETVVKAVGTRVDVIAHTGCMDTASTINLTCHAAQAGAKAAGVVAPWFFGYDNQALEGHYRAVAEAAKGFPIMFYNLPACARNALTAPFIVDLAGKVENIRGLKDSSGDFLHLGEVLAHAPKGFMVINGVDNFCFQAMVTGANGSVASAANVVPELFLAIIENVRKNDLANAWEYQKKLSATAKLLRYGAMVALYKEAVRLRGFDAGYVRLPQRELTAQEKTDFAKAMEALGLI
ncbi:MAG TPA: dihydrodipicolinate synthase family protein [Candidatus Hydrogenedentes bacterium]|jgi:4-hydroxy-tetrahydrodipicolinate synthase|nr:dihydrodipicolinate synthase family protein [Candidatus Hydrogenedentota bacterium]HPJ99781.1 dihydrodipicolinate synthase family protein [Candidatus Hydrogenedentota bacterium]